MTLPSPQSERDDSFSRLSEELHSLLDGVQFTTDTADGSLCLQLPIATGADYRWSIWVYRNGERHVYATEASRSDQDAVEDTVVWYHPFEPDGFKADQRALDAAFLKELRHLLTHHTRVRREAKLVNESVELEASGDGINWTSVYRYSELRTPRALSRGNQIRVMLSSPPLLKRDGSSQSTP